MREIIQLKILRFLVLGIITGFVLTGCGGGGGSANPIPTNPAATTFYDGVFADAPVSGIGYDCGNPGSFLTDEEGKYSIRSSDCTDSMMRFYVGDIFIGQTDSLYFNAITPVHLVSNAHNQYNPTVINIVRFLVTIDNDGQPDNGIQITESVRTLAIGLSVNFDQDLASFGNDSNVINVIRRLTSATDAGERELVSAIFAQDHLRTTLLGFSDSSWGHLKFYELVDGFYNRIEDRPELKCKDTNEAPSKEDLCCVATVNIPGTTGLDYYLIEQDFLENFLTERGYFLDKSLSRSKGGVMVSQAPRQLCVSDALDRRFEGHWPYIAPIALHIDQERLPITDIGESRPLEQYHDLSCELASLVNNCPVELPTPRSTGGPSQCSRIGGFNVCDLF